MEGTIHISTTKGRSLIATKDYVVGDIVLEEDAYAFICCESYCSVACCSCGCINHNVVALDAEDSSRYCSRECLERDNFIHDIERKCLESFSKLQLDGCSDPCRLIIRLACMNMKEDKDIILTELDSNIPLLGRFFLSSTILLLLMTFFIQV